MIRGSTGFLSLLTKGFNGLTRFNRKRMELSVFNMSKRHAISGEKPGDNLVKKIFTAS